MTPPKKTGPRVNRDIDAPRIRLIDHNGEQAGIVTVDEGMRRANDVSLDLVEIAPHASPPVCKILDVGKLKYQEQKKRSEARKKQKTIEIKEIKIRPNIDNHDYDVKMRNAKRFIEDGDKVKVTLRFRGRELAHQELGARVLERIKEELDLVAKVEQMPKMEGRQMVMVVAPR